MITSKYYNRQVRRADGSSVKGVVHLGQPPLLSTLTKGQPYFLQYVVIYQYRATTKVTWLPCNMCGCQVLQRKYLVLILQLHL